MSSKICNRKDLFVPVEIVETPTLMAGEEGAASKVSHAVVVDHPKRGREIVNFCSSVYGLLKNEDLFPPFEEALNEAGIGFEPTYKRDGYSKFYVDYELEADPLMVTEHSEDTIKPMVRIMHSYNGEIRYRAALGFKRLICTNGLWGYSPKSQISMKHTGDNVQIMFSRTVKAINELVQGSEEIRDKYKVLSEKQVRSIPERVDQVMAGVREFHRRQKEEVIRRAETEKLEYGLPQDDWLIYNAFNYQLNHNPDINSADEHKMKIDNKIFKYLSKN